MKRDAGQKYNVRILHTLKNKKKNILKKKRNVHTDSCYLELCRLRRFIACICLVCRRSRIFLYKFLYKRHKNRI